MRVQHYFVWYVPWFYKFLPIFSSKLSIFDAILQVVGIIVFLIGLPQNRPMAFRSYPCKLLLLGEYTIIRGSAALAIPYPRYKTAWSDQVTDRTLAATTLPKMGSQEALQKILTHIRQLQTVALDLVRLEEDLEQGLWLLSDAPVGYGLGSSGTVCAALYDRYAVHPTQDWGHLQQQLAQLENAFHGKSSGIDPLISYLQQPVRVDPAGHLVPLSDLPPLNGTLFLVDTQTPRVSTPLIDFYMAQSETAAFERAFIQPAMAAVERALPAWLAGQWAALYEAVRQLSALQLRHLPPMVLPGWRDRWQRGLDSGDYCLKLCGAGGGGFWLGFAPTWEQVLAHFDPAEIQRVF